MKKFTYMLLALLFSISCKSVSKEMNIVSYEIASSIVERRRACFSAESKISAETEEVSLFWEFEVTTKGNGVLKIGGVGIRIYDSHDDGKIFKSFLLKNYFSDENNDGYFDIVLEGDVVQTSEGSGQVIKEYPIRTVFYFLPKKKIFEQLESHKDIYFYRIIRE